MPHNNDLTFQFTIIGFWTPSTGMTTDTENIYAKTVCPQKDAGAYEHKLVKSCEAFAMYLAGREQTEGWLETRAERRLLEGQVLTAVSNAREDLAVAELARVFAWDHISYSGWQTSARIYAGRP
jgi:hypothetical protein